MGRRGGVVTEDIVKMIRVRHTARVHGETFRGNQEPFFANSEGRFGAIKAARGHFVGVGG